MSEQCQRMSEWTSEWPGTYVWILDYSGPQWKGSLTICSLPISATYLLDIPIVEVANCAPPSHGKDFQSTGCVI